MQPWLHIKFCNDGTPLKPFSCCGKGACNIFCCNCAGGCRGEFGLPAERKSSVSQNNQKAKSCLTLTASTSNCHYTNTQVYAIMKQLRANIVNNYARSFGDSKCSWLANIVSFFWRKLGSSCCFLYGFG